MAQVEQLIVMEGDEKLGLLIKTDTGYEFKYFKDTKGMLFVAFSDINTIYKNNNMFSSFSARLPDKRRPEMKSILKRYKLKEYDEFELLKKTGGVLPIDTYYFVEPIFDINESFIERDFFIYRTQDACWGPLAYVSSLKVEDLNLEIESDDTAKINFNNNFVGYVPKYFSREVCECLKKGKEMQCKVIYINLYCLKVKLTIGNL